MGSVLFECGQIGLLKVLNKHGIQGERICVFEASCLHACGHFIGVGSDGEKHKKEKEAKHGVSLAGNNEGVKTETKEEMKMGKMVWRKLPEAEYRRKVRDAVAEEEGRTRHVYVDNRGIPTLGNGKALVVKGDKGVWKIDPKGEQALIEATHQGYSPEQRRDLQKTADNLNEVGPGNKALIMNTPIIHKAGTSDANTEPGRQERANKPENSRFGIMLAPETELPVFEDTVLAQTEGDFDRRQSEGRNPLDENVPFSEERGALISIHHQCPTCVGPGTREKIKAGDRDGVVREIETKMNGGGNPVVAKRRKREAHRFGRLGPSQSPSSTTPSSKPDKPNEGKQTSSSGGDVHVSAYHRSTGPVAEHYRGPPDGDPSNNKSYASKAQGQHQANGYREPDPWEKKIPGVLY